MNVLNPHSERVKNTLGMRVVVVLINTSIDVLMGGVLFGYDWGWGGMIRHEN